MPGFIANRILLPYINEAFYALMESIGTPDAIDTTMKVRACVRARACTGSRRRARFAA